MMSSCNVGLGIVALRPSASVSHCPTAILDLHMLQQQLCTALNVLDKQSPSTHTGCQAGLQTTLSQKRTWQGVDKAVNKPTYLAASTLFGLSVSCS